MIKNIYKDKALTDEELKLLVTCFYQTLLCYNEIPKSCSSCDDVIECLQLELEFNNENSRNSNDESK